MNVLALSLQQVHNRYIPSVQVQILIQIQKYKYISAPGAQLGNSNKIVYKKTICKNISHANKLTLYTRCSCIFTTHTHKYKYKKTIPKVRNTNAETTPACHKAPDCTKTQCSMMRFWCIVTLCNLWCIACWCRCWS